ncbi:MAG: hypothetical protein Alpg2KO_05620 [Alphaproteobacteria bacterium]
MKVYHMRSSLEGCDGLEITGAEPAPQAIRLAPIMSLLGDEEREEPISREEFAAAAEHAFRDKVFISEPPITVTKGIGKLKAGRRDRSNMDFPDWNAILYIPKGQGLRDYYEGAFYLRHIFSKRIVEAIKAAGGARLDFKELSSIPDDVSDKHKFLDINNGDYYLAAPDISVDYQEYKEMIDGGKWPP